MKKKTLTYLKFERKTHKWKNEKTLTLRINLVKSKNVEKDDTL